MIDFSEIKNVLILAPHTDDGEFGCGATIAKLIDQGTKVSYIAFSSCEESVPQGFPKDVLKTEVTQATSKLEIKHENLYILDYKVRYFSYHRQEILEDLIRFRKLIDPDMVFIPSINDIHQDHKTIAEESVRAFKNRNILSYELTWNNFNFSMDFFSVINQTHLNKKITALQEYKSQIAIRGYASLDFIKSLAKVRGTQIGEEYAEVFEVVRLIDRI